MTIINLGTRVVNSYLISPEGGYILVDTGYADGFPLFIKWPRKNGIDPKEIRCIKRKRKMRTGLIAMLIILCMAVACMFPTVAEDVSKATPGDRELSAEQIQRIAKWCYELYRK